MNRILAAALVALLVAPSAGAQSPWVEGRHYQQVASPQPAREDGKIEVVELFWYGCPSCYTFEPLLQEWLANKPADVEFIRYAASLSQGWRLHARAYYTAESLGVVDQVHLPLFRAIHEERQSLSTPDAIAAVFAEHAGTDAAAFQSAFDSFGVENRLRRGDQVARQFQVRGVPTVIVNRKYITGPTQAQGYEALVRLVDHLIELERGAPAPAADPAPATTPATTPAPEPAATAATPAIAEPESERAVEMWWLWLAALLVVGGFVAVRLRR